MAKYAGNTKATKAQLNGFARQALNGTLPEMSAAWECLNCGGTGKGSERSDIETRKVTTPACSCWHFGYLKFETFMDTGKAQFTIISKGNGKLPFYAFQSCQASHVQELVTAW